MSAHPRATRSNLQHSGTMTSITIPSKTHHYLRTCAELFPTVTRLRYGRAQDLRTIEDELADIQSRRRLTYDDINKIRRSSVLDFSKFGYWPERQEMGTLLEWDFRNLPTNEIDVIKRLQDVFRQIEVVSVILRFVAPTHYGIISPPVEQILGIGARSSHRSKYLTYLRNLRDIRNHAGMATAAEADTALWVLQVGVLNGTLDRDLPELPRLGNTLRKNFRKDALLRRIRVGNLTSQLFRDMKRFALADALFETNPELAGQIAGIEFERSLRRIANPSPDSKPGLFRLVELACGQQPLAASHKDTWQKAALTRHKLVHEQNTWTGGEVRQLIEVMHESRRVAKWASSPDQG